MSLQPVPLAACPLPQYDDEMAAKAKEAADAGEVLRYVGVVDIANSKCAVCPPPHPPQPPSQQLMRPSIFGLVSHAASLTTFLIRPAQLYRVQRLAILCHFL